MSKQIQLMSSDQANQVLTVMGGLAKELEGLDAKLNRLGLQGVNSPEISEERQAFTKYLRHGDKGITTKDADTLRVGENPLGGYQAPAEVSQDFIRELVEYSPIRGLATVKQTSQSSIRFPKRIGRTNAKWKGELEEVEKSGFGFGELEITPKELSTYVDVSNLLLSDAVTDIEAEVRMAFSEDFGVKEGAAHLYGDGVVSPKGLLVDDELDYFPNGHAANISADKLIEFTYSLPAYYRQRGTWLMNGTTLGKLRILRDGHQNYLWQPSYQAGQPETILGRPVVEAVDMPDATSGKCPILFGDFAEGYLIVDRVELHIFADPYTQAKNGVTRFYGWRRTGAGVRQKAALRKYKMATS